jgi:LAO/AO transport system kinase
MTRARTLTLAALRSGGKPAMATALAEIERKPNAKASLDLLDRAFMAPRAHVLGVTGPPGVGKSTLAGALVGLLRERGEMVGVIAVDPSSRTSGGALLGDRLRLSVEADEGVFVRSMAARDRLGGLADLTVAAATLMRAVYDRVLIETVGVGQSETDIAIAADTILFCVQPGSGDALQFMKAGIVEIPDIVAVTKSDLGQAAAKAAADAALGLDLGLGERGRPAPTVTVSASRRRGLDALLAAVEDHRAWLGEDDRLARRRHEQALRWLKAALRDRFGQDGLARLGQVSLKPDQPPFSHLAELARTLGSDEFAP